MRRVVLLVVDGLGVGELPDAADYGDAGSNTLLNAARAAGLRAPTLDRLGLGRIQPAPGLSGPEPAGAFGRMAEASAGKDSMTGHRELVGVVRRRPFETFPDGFGPDLVEPLAQRIGRRPVGNVVLPGPEAVERFGAEALERAAPILYTSTDSVMQIAAHVDVVNAEELYTWCEAAREICGERVGRVIARPFSGPPGAFDRLHDGRRDFPVPMPAGSALHDLREAGLSAVAVGKVGDLFEPELFDVRVGPGTDAQTLYAALSELARLEAGLVFVNAGDIDSKYGHRNDPAGWCEAFHRLDSGVAHILEALGPADVLIVTGDHGNDPVTPSTDHSREYVPVLAVSGRGWARGSGGADLGTRATFADVGATVTELLTGHTGAAPGTSFADRVDI